MDGPWEIENLFSFALSVLGWQPDQFLNCTTYHFKLACIGHQRMYWAEQHLRFVADKRLACSIAEIMAGDPNKVNDYYDLNYKPLSPIASKIEAMDKHFKENI